jgi:hypothetical protein
MCFWCFFLVVGRLVKSVNEGRKREEVGAAEVDRSDELLGLT